MIECPGCGKKVAEDNDPPIPPEEQCNPIRSPQCWKVTGMSRNGSPILTLVDGGGEGSMTEGNGLDG